MDDRSRHLKELMDLSDESRRLSGRIWTIINKLIPSLSDELSRNHTKLDEIHTHMNQILATMKVMEEV